MDNKELPPEPTREMWAAMSDAYYKAYRDSGREPTLAADFVTEAIYRAAVKAAKEG